MDVRRQGQAADNSYAEAPVAPRSSAGSTVSKMGNSPVAKVLAILLIIVSLCAIGWFAQRVYGSVRADAAVNSKEYQAIFLTNGQVYFGKFTHVDSTYVELTKIFYLQVQQQVQPGQTSTNSQQQVSLAKLGGELHGPEDEMFINRDQILFWENLKPSGKVSTAIANYYKTGSAQ
jgi:hypothetical protein